MVQARDEVPIPELLEYKDATTLGWRALGFYKLAATIASWPRVACCMLLWSELETMQGSRHPMVT